MSALTAYRDVLRTPGVSPVVVLGFLARLPFSTLGLLLTLHTVYTLHESFFAAGLIVAAQTLGAAISSPWRGRLVDQKGLRRAVLPSVVIQTGTLIASVFVGYWPLVALAFLGGLFAIPVFSIVRTSLSVLVPAHQRRSAFALDAVVTEFVFMIGPAAATLLALGIGSKPTLLIIAGCVAAAGVGLMIVDPPTRSDHVMLPTKLPKALQAMEDAVLSQTEYLSEKRVAEDLTTGAIPIVGAAPVPSARRALLTLGGLAILVGTAIASLILTATDVALVALMKDADAEAMIALAMTLWCAGSAIGGLGYGAMTREIPPLLVIAVLGLVTLPVALAHSVPMILLTVFVAGVAVAPAITATGEAISHLVPEESRGEAMGWHGSAMTIGGAIGGPVIGAIIDVLGASAALAIAGGIGVAVAGGGLGAMRVRRVRRRRGLEERFGG